MSTTNTSSSLTKPKKLSFLTPETIKNNENNNAKNKSLTTDNKKSVLLSSSLPNLATTTTAAATSNLIKNKRFVDSYSTINAARTKNQFTRLSGLSDTISSSGLYAENSISLKPRTLCVRCGTLASLCVPCSDLICENAVTFYRKTRAAGAAALFAKSFTEAGNSKLVKFFVFRLLKNSYTTRHRKQQKMINVVEKLVGQNIVILPFTAWRRYTKENIINRKDKSIAQLTEKVNHLESQISRLSSSKTSLEKKVAELKEDNEQKAEKIIAQETEIKSLLETIKKERKRVVGLASLAKPLQTYSGLVDRFLFQESREIRHQLHYAATTTPSFNYQHIFDEGVIEDLGQLRREREQRNFFTSSVYKSNVKGEIAVSVQIVVDWITNTSTNAGNHIESSSGKSLNVYLPSPDEEVTSLSKLATGRDLCRVIVALIYDTIAARSETINRFREHQALNTVTPTGKQKRRLSVMLSHASNTSLTVSLGDLHHISTIQNNPLELLSYSLKLAVQYLQLPMFKAIDIFAGKSDIIYALGVALMACSKPIVHREDATEINDQIEKIQRLNRMHEKIFDSKKELSLLKEIYRNRSIHLGEEITDEFFGDSRQATELQLDSVVGKEKDGAKPDSSEPVQGQVYKVVNRDETYSFLTESIDQFLKKREDFYVTKLSVEDLDICQEFLNLQITAAKSREKREFGMKMTTELRKFVETKFIESVMRKSGILADELSEV